MSYGHTTDIGIIFQNSYGTAGDVGSAHFIPYLSEGIGLTIPPQYSENMRGIHDEGDSYDGPRTIDGTLEVEAQPIALGAILKSVLQLTGSVNSGGIYTHTFKPRVSDFDDNCAHDPVTVYKYFQTGSATRFYDLNGNSLELNMSNGEFLKASVDFVGGSFNQVSNTTAAYPIGKRWNWDVASFSIGGTGIDNLTELTVTIDESLEAGHTLNGSKYPSRIKRTGFRSIAVNGTAKFDNQTEYQQFISQSERELIVNCKGPTEIQSGYYEELNLKLPLMRYEDFKPVVEGPGENEVSFTARGKYSVDSATSMQLTLVNTQATY